MAFLRAEKIPGVMFLTGDRHHSEIIRVEGLLSYPLFDITSSPLTSVGVDQKQNYARISVSGAPRARVLKVEYIGIKGELLGQWSVAESDLRTR